MPLNLNGATRVHFIVGDPIAQVKSPAGVSQAFADLGLNAMVMPAHVSSDQLSDWLAGVSLARNVDGIIVTVPHKFAAYQLCASTSERAAFVQSVNTLRRRPDGQWHGDMFDGMGYLAAMRRNGCEPAGRSALLVGTGGAGSAIAHSLVQAGVSRLALHDTHVPRRDALIARLAPLAAQHGGSVVAGSDDPAGYDIVLNATPMGMRPGDPTPVQLGRLDGGMHVGDVITAPEITPLLQAALALGCGTQRGADMFANVCDLMVAFLTEPQA
jgi:shikimate dehydrogenase